jgi:hypothetical protein
MRITFRQGIVSHQSGGFLQYNVQNNVDILANTRAVTITVAEKNSNYTFTEDRDIVNAWIGPFDVGTTYWLYWNFDTQTFARTFAYTDVEPITQATTPANPEEGLIWFDTSKNEMFRWSGLGWFKIIAAFAGTLFNGTFASYSINAPLFTGTQVGITTPGVSGRPLYNSAGRTIRNGDNTFITTESGLYINDSQSAAIRLESNIVRAKNVEAAMAEFNIVAYSGPGEIRTAQYADAQETITAVLMENLIADQIGVVIPQGMVVNPNWNFTNPIGTPLWIDNGVLISVDPHITDSITNPIPKTPVARVLSSDSILFEQGLGGVGPKGPKGNVSGQTPASVSSLGSVALSTAPAVAAAPIAVSDTDPRISGGPFASLVHPHEAAAISYVPGGTITATNVQAAIIQSTNGTAQITGDTFTGPVILSGAPTQPLEAATSQYVIDLTTGKADAIHTHTAGEITLAPVGGVVATDVQSGFAELDNNKFDKTGGTISGALTVTGIGQFNSTVDFAAGITTQADAAIDGSLFVTTNLTVVGDSSVIGNATTSGNSTVTGNAGVVGTLNVTGIATLIDNILIGGDASVTGNMLVTGNSDVIGNADITGNLDVSGNINMTGVVNLSADPTTGLQAATKDYVDNKVTAAALTELPYDLTFFIAGPAASIAGSTVGLIVVPRAVSIETAVTNVFGRALTPPLTTVVYELFHNNAVIGTITFDPAVAGGIEPTYSIPNNVNMLAGAYIEVRPTTQETNIANVGATIIACSTDINCP